MAMGRVRQMHICCLLKYSTWLWLASAPLSELGAFPDSGIKLCGSQLYISHTHIIKKKRQTTEGADRFILADAQI